MFLKQLTEEMPAKLFIIYKIIDKNNYNTHINI